MLVIVIIQIQRENVLFGNGMVKIFRSGTTIVIGTGRIGMVGVNFLKKMKLMSKLANFLS